jgi:uncharacterized protein
MLDVSMMTALAADLARQRKLIAAFATALQRECGSVRMFETHISCVIVAAGLAYKFKKAVRLAFLDFSSLEKRRFYCDEELRLNRRLAPEIYLSVVAFCGEPENPVASGEGSPLEYAVKMRAFGQDALWSERIGQGVLTAFEVDGLAHRLDAFHRDAHPAPEDSSWCTPDALERLASENFSELAALAADASTRKDITWLRQSVSLQAKQLHPVFLQRKQAGGIRECHGDLHCANVITVDGQPTAFDCIEFNDSMRWIDVMNDLAFLCMDLECRGGGDLAATLLNAYLERCGDYAGLRVFRYYKTLRAVIRCKVAWLRATQLGRDVADASGYQAQGQTYLDFAIESIRGVQPVIMITHGLPGCGKSTFSELAGELLGAVRIRSDVERKRLHGLAATDRSGLESLYGVSATERTYAHLATLAEQVAAAGWPVVIDAAFLRREQRQPFRLLAARLGIPFFIFDLHASEGTLRRRVAARKEQNRDASDAGVRVLLSQLAQARPLDADEMSDCIEVDTDAGIDPGQAREKCEPILRLRQSVRQTDRPPS